MMAKRLLAVFCAVALPLPAAFAQSLTPAPPPQGKSGEKATGENFVVALTPAGKDGEGFSLIVTPPQVFHVSRGGLAFDGTLALTDGGAYRLDYSLDTNAERGGPIHTGSSVTLRPGEPVQLVRNGEQFYNLRMDHYPPPADAKAEPPRSLAH